MNKEASMENELAHQRKRGDMSECEKLALRIEMQAGSADGVSDDEWDEFVADAERTGRKIRWERGAGFGSPVTVKWDSGEVFFGYLTTLPGYSQEDMEGVVHLLEVDEGESVWLTITDLAALPFVKTIHIGDGTP